MVRRNFGTMPYQWQDRQTFKPGDNPHTKGFHFIMRDGYEFDHAGGCATIPNEIIHEHGRVMKSRELA